MNLKTIQNCSRCSNELDGNESERNLTPETKQFLDKTKYKFLCNNCLDEISGLVKKSVGDSFPQKGEPLIENLHYYIENGFWVFTEYYHLLRGNCCGNKCRHCAYGIQK